MQQASKPSFPKKTTFNAQRIAEQKLIDTKVIRQESKFSKTLAGAIILGFIAGGAVLAYFLLIKPASVEPSVDIIVPDDSNYTTPAQEPADGEELPAPDDSPGGMPTEKFVEILETGTGYLNVRKGPGTNFEKISQVTPGESYTFEEEDSAAGWYKITLADGTSGWVTKQYAKIKE